MPAQTAGGTYKWVGQGKMKPVTNAQYASVTLAFAKASGIIVLTEELVRLSTPSAETAVRDELVKGRTLPRHAVRGFHGGCGRERQSGLNHERCDRHSGFSGNDGSGTHRHRGSPRRNGGSRLSAQRARHPNERVAGVQSRLGLNAVGRRSSPASPLPAERCSVFRSLLPVSRRADHRRPRSVDPHCGRKWVEIDISREASIQLDSAPTDPPDATAVLTSLWQANLVGLRVERYITWGKARTTAVDRITSVAYAP
jgi:hypothetical protein